MVGHQIYKMYHIKQEYLADGQVKSFEIIADHFDDFVKRYLEAAQAVKIGPAFDNLSGQSARLYLSLIYTGIND